MTMDLHADQIQGFFDVPVDALYASGIFVPYIRSLNIEDLSIAAPDMGGAKRANTYAKHLGTPIIISHKERAKAKVIVTDTIPLREDQNLSKFTVLSVADIFADVIERVHNYKEISSIFFK